MCNFVSHCKLWPVNSYWEKKWSYWWGYCESAVFNSTDFCWFFLPVYGKERLIIKFGNKNSNYLKLYQQPLRLSSSKSNSCLNARTLIGESSPDTLPCLGSMLYQKLRWQCWHILLDSLISLQINSNKPIKSLLQAEKLHFIALNRSHIYWFILLKKY